MRGLLFAIVLLMGCGHGVEYEKRDTGTGPVISDPSYETDSRCSMCNGTGQRFEYNIIFKIPMMTPCVYCGGTGRR